MYIGGSQGPDAKGTGFSYDVKSPTGETLNNKEITDAAQGATDISKFAIEFNKQLKKSAGPGKAGDWPEFLKLCAHLGLSDNITETSKTIKKTNKKQVTQKAKVPNVQICGGT